MSAQDARLDCVVDFLDAWSYCSLSRPGEGAGRAEALRNVAQQFLDALDACPVGASPHHTPSRGRSEASEQ